MKNTADTTMITTSTTSLRGQARITQGRAATTASAAATAKHDHGGGMRVRPSPITVRARSATLLAGQIPPVPQ